MRVVFRYLFFQFLMIFLALSLAVLFVIFLGEFASVFEAVGKKAELSVGESVILAFSRAPESFFLAVPHVMFLSALYGFWRLFRHQEWTILRNSGLNFWQIVAGYATAAGVISIVIVTLLQPLFTGIRHATDHLEYKKKSADSKLSLGATGLWLSQKRDNGYVIIHAKKINVARKQLEEVSLTAFDVHYKLLYQLEGKAAYLHNEILDIESAWKFFPDGDKRFFAEYALPSNLSMVALEKSITKPTEVSFWDMGSFIKMLEDSGFSSGKYRIQFFKMLFEPLMNVSLVFLAMVLSKSPPRRYDAIKTVGMGMAMMIGITVIQDIFQTQGAYQRLPIILATAIVPLVVGLLSVAAMMQAEES